jgi:hypothetical protein
MKLSQNKPDDQKVTKAKQIKPDIPVVPDFSEIIKNSPSGFILRKDLSEKTGGLLHGRTMANLDSLGTGIPDRITIGNRKVAYPVMAVVEYLQAKTTVNHAPGKRIFHE